MAAPGQQLPPPSVPPPPKPRTAPLRGQQPLAIRNRFCPLLSKPPFYQFFHLFPLGGFSPVPDSHLPTDPTPFHPRPGSTLPPYGREEIPPEAEERTYSGRTVAGLHIPGASTMYTLLGSLLLVAGILALIMPYRLTDVFFRGHRRYYDAVMFEELWRILGATFFAAATVCYSLKTSADKKELADPTVQRLQLGFFWFGLTAVVLHLVHLLLVKSLTLWGLVLGAVIMAPTLLLPSVHLTMSGGFGLAATMEVHFHFYFFWCCWVILVFWDVPFKPIQSARQYNENLKLSFQLPHPWCLQGVQTCMSNLFTPRRATVTVIFYSLLTVIFTVAGLAYLILPRPTLRATFGYHVGSRAVFLWQWIGAGMLFLFPAMTYTCQEAGVEGMLHRTVPRVLNVGLLVAALFHILEFGSQLVADGVAVSFFVFFSCS
jgi:hypothetical protein